MKNLTTCAEMRSRTRAVILRIDCRIALSLLLTAAVINCFSLRSFAAYVSSGAHVNKKSIEVNGLDTLAVRAGVLMGRGSITVDGYPVESGATILDGSTIVTGPDGYGWVDNGAFGRVKLGPGTTVTLSLPAAETPRQAQPRRTIRPVGSGPNISLKAGNALQLQVQVTDENDKPVRDEAVVFTLSDPASGSLGAQGGAAGSVTATTDANGIATTTFTAGKSASSTSITASSGGATFSYRARIRAGLGLLALLLIGGAAAGTVTTIVLVSRNGQETRQPLSPSRP
ncbi:MAG TPA: Ig-like domain-containing protein [Blastocatellia bacterium]|jgi:hypothetical protein